MKNIVITLPRPTWAAIVRLLEKGVSEIDQEWFSEPEEFIAITEATYLIRSKIAPPVTDQLLPHQVLSDRELEVFVRIAQGKAPATIADELGISVKTVSTYRARLLKKTGMRANAQIASYAVLNNLVPV